jgi:pyrroline-5-carboxylate reductase
MQKIGFIGAGRIAGIILEGWERKNLSLRQVHVMDANPDVSAKLKERFPEIQTVTDIRGLRGSDIIFIAVHPPAMPQVLQEVKEILDSRTLVCSLAPKVSIDAIDAGLGGHSQIIRMNPNAPSLVNSGFNPVAFSTGVNRERRVEFISLMNLLGDCPETKEKNLEAFAVISAMGPTYLWFQLYELIALAGSFGLTGQEALDAVTAMTVGAARTVAEAGLPPEAVQDLVPSKPLSNDENAISEIYRERLTAIYQKLKA